MIEKTKYARIWLRFCVMRSINNNGTIGLMDRFGYYSYIAVVRNGL